MSSHSSVAPQSTTPKKLLSISLLAVLLASAFQLTLTSDFSTLPAAAQGTTNVEFATPTASANEADGNNLPSLLLSGTVASESLIDITLNDTGTATLGQDYTFGSQAAALPVTVPLAIPAGTYTATTPVPLNDLNLRFDQFVDSYPLVENEIGSVTQGKETFVAPASGTYRATLSAQGFRSSRTDGTPNGFLQIGTTDGGNNVFSANTNRIDAATPSKTYEFNLVAGTTYYFTTEAGGTSSMDNVVLDVDYIPSVDLSITDEFLPESDETINLTLSNPQGDLALGEVAGGALVDTHEYTILNDDISFTVDVSDVTITEGDTGTTDAQVTFTLSQAPGSTGATVIYSIVDGTATTADSDYTTLATDRVTFGPAETVKTINIPITADVSIEDAESFTVEAYLDIARDAGFDSGTTYYTPLPGTSTCNNASFNNQPYDFETNPQDTYDGINSGNTNRVLEVDCLSQGLQSGLSTVVGNEYEVSFDASRRITAGTPSSLSVTVDAIDESTGTVINSATVTRSNTTFGFVKTKFNFTATSPTTTLRFTTGNREGLGMIFDNLSINPITPTDTGTITIENDDLAEIVVNRPTGVALTEEGANGSFGVTLAAQPAGNVTVTAVSPDTGAVAVAPASLLFTPANWNTPQSLTVAPVTDADLEDESLEITFAIDTANSDAAFAATPAVTRSVTVTDNDAAGVDVDNDPGITVIEDGANGAFNVALEAQPSTDVTVTVESSDTGAAMVSPATLTFTSANWDTTQPVTVTPISDDDVVDENVTITFAVDNDTSDDEFDNLSLTRAVTINDDDTATIVVNPGSVTVTEAAGTDTFTVVLGAQPTGDVVLDLTSSDLGEGTISPATMTFTAANWNVPQTATITGVDDNVDTPNDDLAFISVAVNDTSSDDDFDGLSESVAVTFTDDDTVGISISETTLTASEDGTVTGTYTISMDTETTSSPVVVDVTPDSQLDLGNGAGAAIGVAFSSSDSFAPKTVTVTAVDDSLIEGEHTGTITHEINQLLTNNLNGYDAVTGIPDVTTTITDNDAPGLTVDNTAGLTITEDTDTGTFNAVLDAQPTTDVVVDVTSSDTGAATISPATLTFTAADWDQPQPVTVTPVSDDDLLDESVTVTSAVNDATSDDSFDGLTSTRTVTIQDDDAAGYTITPDAVATITEGNQENLYSVVLTAEPENAVNIAVTTTSAAITVDTTPSTLTFDATNWNQPQTIAVTAVEDDNLVSETNQAISFEVVNSDSEWTALEDQLRNVNVTDNDAATVIVSPGAITINEDAGNGTFTVVLGAQPASDVVIDLTSTQTGEATVSPATLTFTSDNWNKPQTVTTTGVNDDAQSVDTSAITVTVNDAASDDNFDGLTDTVDVTILDDDAAGITVTPIDTVTDEDGDTGSATVVLNSRPTSNVTIDLSSSDTTEGTVAPAQLVFTPSDWNVPQTITITGIDGDNVSDGAVAYTIATAPAVSADANYSGVDAPDIAMQNQNTDAPGIKVANSASTTSEDGTTLTLTYTLLSDPIGEVVTIPVSLADGTEATLDIDSVVLDSSNYSTGVVVTITGVNDTDLDGDVVYTVVSGDSVSDGQGNNEYGGITVADFTLTNLDNDVDTDGDGTSDEQETRDGTDPDDSDDYLDTDGDGVPDVIETEQSTDPNDDEDFLDTDNGGIADYVETTLLVNNGLPATNPNDISDDDRDTDGDGVPDVTEIVRGTDPQDEDDFQDTDGDGIPDYIETQQGTDPDDKDDYLDTDGDGTPDYIETRDGTDPSDPDDFKNTDGGDKGDYQEIRDGSDPTDSSDDLDADGDGISDADEQATAGGGDANADGTPDYLQGGVVTVTNTTIDAPVTLEATGVCNFVNAFEIVTEASLATQDDAAEYILGLHDFVLTCATPGASADVTVIWDQVYDTSEWTYKKYESSSYTNIDSFVTYGTRTIDGVEKTTSSYTVTDGGDLDLDGTVNNSITDPAGPSIPVETDDTDSDGPTALVRTGGEALKQYFAPLLLIGAGLVALATTVVSKLRRQG